MKVENIPSELLCYIYDGGEAYYPVIHFDKEFPPDEDRTADSIMMDAWLSFTLPN